MSSWNLVEQAVPDLARRAHGILACTTNCVLATVRQDGTPRLSGIDPLFADGDLWLGSMPDARKGADLRRDPRLALHSIPWESRSIRAGGTDPGSGDAKLTGRAVPVTDPGAFAKVGAAQEAASGQAVPPPYDLFRIDVTELVVIGVEDEQFLVIDRWTEADGRKTVRRT